jgi:hypothetical protein
MVTCHSNMLVSSARPAEKPLFGFFWRSVCGTGAKAVSLRGPETRQRMHACGPRRTFELLC